MTPTEATAAPDLALSAYGPARSTVSGTPLSAEESRRTDAWNSVLRRRTETTQGR
jgi:hypothetical protein